MLLATLLLSAELLLSRQARAGENDERSIARDDEITELKRKLDVVVTELETLRTQLAAPEIPADLESQNGLGPAASKVYGAARGLSIGGYAEGVYRQSDFDVEGGKQDTVDLTRATLYVGYKFNDWIVWNSEIEFEHATTEQNGSVNVEFATLDFLFAPEFNLRMGAVLLPVGITNEVHEPPFYYGTRRPVAETQIIPSTWSEYGVGFFGGYEERVRYAFYVVGGLNALGFESSGIREARQSSSEALANDLAVVGALELDVLPGWVVGGSYYVGGAGQNQSVELVTGNVDVPSTRTTLWEAHTEYEWRALTARALWTQAHISDAGRLSEILFLTDAELPVIARRMIGGYGEVAYDIIPIFFPGSEMSLEPFFRFEYVDTQNDVPSGLLADRSFKQRIYVPGLQFKPISNVVLKLDYRKIDDFAHTGGDEVSFGFGLVF
jgi:hypothetical protein